MKMIDNIHHFLAKKRSVVIVITLLGIVASVYSFWPSGSTTIDDRDFVDNKYATNPTTNIDFIQIQNPKPKNRLSYEIISLNKKNDSLYHSEFRLGITTPQGGWFSLEDDVGFSSTLTSCKQLPLKNGDTLGGLQYFSNGQTGQFSHQRIECTSQEEIVDDGNIFFLRTPY